MIAAVIPLQDQAVLNWLANDWIRQKQSSLSVYDSRLLVPDDPAGDILWYCFVRAAAVESTAGG